MTYKDLHNNNDLFIYLQFLAKELKENEQNSLAEEVISASCFATGSASEFLNEAQITLMKILNTSPPPLSSKQLREVKSVIMQIEEAFRKIGGA